MSEVSLLLEKWHLILEQRCWFLDGEATVSPRLVMNHTWAPPRPLSSHKTQSNMSVCVSHDGRVAVQMRHISSDSVNIASIRSYQRSSPSVKLSTCRSSSHRLPSTINATLHVSNNLPRRSETSARAAGGLDLLGAVSLMCLPVLSDSLGLLTS